METLLHVGCGGAPVPPWLADYKETRLDVDGEFNPHIIANMTNMYQVESHSYDVIYCAHSLEHLFPQDVPLALSEFCRILKQEGRAIIIVPDLEGVSPTTEVLFESEAGPITGLDLIYGFGKQVKTNPHMQHHCGFVQHTLEKILDKAGFNPVVRRIGCNNLLALAVKR